MSRIFFGALSLVVIFLGMHRLIKLMEKAEKGLDNFIKDTNYFVPYIIFCIVINGAISIFLGWCLILSCTENWINVASMFDGILQWVSNCPPRSIESKPYTQTFIESGPWPVIIICIFLISASLGSVFQSIQELKDRQ